MHTRIFLIGFMGSGKTTLGRKLAGKLKYDFVDMDHLIEQTSGMTVPGIFSEHGEDLFRKWESDILKEILRMDHVVVATGGGAACHNNNMTLMKQHGLTIYLQLAPEAIRDRLLKSKTQRPLVKGKEPDELLEYIKELLSSREGFYLQSDLVIHGINLHVEELLNAISRLD